MRVSLAWIKRLLQTSSLPMDDAHLQDRIALSVCEIAAHERTMAHLDGVVVGRVLSCAAHPNAERLRLTTVTIGTATPLRIVCGAPNVAVGQTVAVATIGTTLSMADAAGVPKAITIKAAKLRGEPSEGMICAADELGLGTDHDGILVLDASLVPGTPLAQALGLGDTVWVIENQAITHRPDLWGHLGWAREVATACAIAPPVDPVTTVAALGTGWSVTLADDGCSTYCGAVVENLGAGTTPRWMSDSLLACGVRPMGLIVDITNYVMLELGEPLHAFDVRQVPGRHLVVRAARAAETFTTLDGVSRSLDGGDLLICDGERPVALAGIMGGMDSMIRPDTTAILLEAAIFRPERIRRTRQRTGLSSDASARFERGLFPEMAPAGLARALQLLREFAPGCRLTHAFHSGPTSQPALELPFDPAMVGRLTGLPVEEPVQRGILGRLGFQIAAQSVAIPWWRRKDVRVTVDLVEEVARHYGYERIQPAIPRLAAASPTPNQLSRLAQRSRRCLSALGWDEVATYVLTSETWAAALAGDAAGLIRIEHPLSSEQTVLRPSLAGGLLDALARNRRHAPAVAIYEVGKRYGLRIGLAPRSLAPAAGGCEDEVLVLAGVISQDALATPFYAARAAALRVLHDLGYGTARLAAGHADLPPWLVAGRAAVLISPIDQQPVGVVGEIAPAARALGDVPGAVGYFEIPIEALLARYGAPKPLQFLPPSRFQRVEREFTWVSPEQLSYAQLAESTLRAAGELGQGVELVTIYRGDPIPAGHKALSLRLALQSATRTLEDKELARLTERVISQVTRDTGAQLRA